MNETPSITEQKLSERCAALAQIIKDYDALFARIVPFTHKDNPDAQMLRARARDELVDLPEPFDWRPAK